MGPEQTIPWVLALATAAWFGWQAHRAERPRFLWCVSGFFFGLFVGTVVLGLAHATFIPLTSNSYRILLIKAVAAAVIVILLVGWIITAGLHRHHVMLWDKALKKR